MRPRDVRTERQWRKMRKTSMGIRRGGFPGIAAGIAIAFDGSVWFVDMVGNRAMFSRQDFAKIVDWYNRHQKPKAVE